MVGVKSFWSENEKKKSIPFCLGKLPSIILASKLEELYLRGNNLSGNIPDSISNASTLVTLDLHQNSFSGHIPDTIGNLTSFEVLRTWSNHLTSKSPNKEWSFVSSTAKCKKLRVLQILLNPLKGIIPTSISNLSASVEDFNAVGCQIKGSIPMEIGSVNNIIHLSLSQNELSGSIPATIGKLKKVTRLLDFFENPGLVLQQIVFDHTFHEILDLSNNNFSGIIPKSLEKLYYLSYFNVAFNILEGETPTEGCFTNFTAGSFMKNYALCGSPRLEVPHCKNSTHRLSKRTLIMHVWAYVLPPSASIILVVTFIIVLKKYLNKSRKFSIREDSEIQEIRSRNLYNRLLEATDEFSEGNLLGSGSFGSRINIMIDVASALEYLHLGHPNPIIHCDLKPSNVLLDRDMVAHVGDFGIAKLLGEAESVKQTMTLATIGYMAPEYGSTRIVSRKTDVYSYAYYKIQNEADQHFMAKANCISSIMSLALNCSVELPEETKDMKDIVSVLKRIKIKFLNNVSRA
ncbi:hypothetical protein DITRI_Ditri10aG0181100 [Diplodiscus trichospermus]